MLLPLLRGLRLGAATLVVCTWIGDAQGATSITNSLTGFTGNSTEGATQTATTAAGFTYASLSGFDGVVDPTVNFDASGAKFGAFPGDEGRNYMWTVDADYAGVNFVAEVTVTVDTLGSDQAFFGMGAGEIGTWGVPDNFNTNSTVFFTPEHRALSSNSHDVNGGWTSPVPPSAPGDWSHLNGDFNDDLLLDGADVSAWQRGLGLVATGEDPSPTLAQGNSNGDTQVDAVDHDVWAAQFGIDAPGLSREASGTHRLRMTYDSAAKTWRGEIDVDYAGGPFAADRQTPLYDLSASFTNETGDGWPIEPARIYFGGDDGAIFKDFVVTVSGVAAAAGSGVPEPSCAALAVACGAGWLRRRRK